MEKITCGVPQGSILGPLFFTLYVNDLPECITHGATYLYADDMAIAVSNPDPTLLAEQLNANLTALASLFHEH